MLDLSLETTDTSECWQPPTAIITPSIFRYRNSIIDINKNLPKPLHPAQPSIFLDAYIGPAIDEDLPAETIEEELENNEDAMAWAAEDGHTQTAYWGFHKWGYPQ